MTETMTAMITARCQQQHWYGPDAFNGRRAAEPGKSLFQNGFALAPMNEAQERQTEALLGFSLSPLLCALYHELANGGFGPGGGLRGAVGGYGTVGTPLPNDYRWLGDETLVKYHLNRESLVDLARFADGWQQHGQTRVLRLPCAVWPRQLFPICDLGDDVEVCLDTDGHLYRYASSEEEGIYSLNDTGMTFEQWIHQWIAER